MFSNYFSSVQNGTTLVIRAGRINNATEREPWCARSSCCGLAVPSDRPWSRKYVAVETFEIRLAMFSRYGSREVGRAAGRQCVCIDTGV